ncbi:1-aminocyclopropane-1-carboxylate deaminase/D-cysteine desulfhydrase [Parapedobacter indicus]|uniref:1-aminocyclopropane-1-carboxylate deaminase n=1 Tax=Parapedobacter indicus TaxID=1477437 RepID=A0A1I3IAA1_9SPHI|nr:pyridoxal-phosphate dependent enzyme [Parapedobacter indicus]PPL02077.1 1-aminocyclopropane-1-carboxylate deaminase [Parapedobacter indicus]SFI44780.1 1-aminocyclopropane-1-carboxylate deaminase [Parapedobacter indicus]
MFSFDFHSPIEALNFPLFSDKRLTLHIKRDDLIHPFISGNKWRKLKYILQEAAAQQKTRLVTFGGAWSNHLLATACAGAKFGFNTTAFVRGEEVSNANLSLCKLFGMELRFVDRTAYKDKQALFHQNFGSDKQAYFIDEGGYSREGAKGCGDILDELSHAYSHIFCAAGTGTTLAGIAEALAAKKSAIQLHGVPVLTGGAFIRNRIAELSTDSVANTCVLHTDYHFGGYAKTKPELTDFIKYFCTQTGILIEPVYTGKLCYAVFDLAKDNYFANGDNILIIHTGGLVGLLGMEKSLHL